MNPITVELPDQIWFRVALDDWDDPLDPTFAQTRGGRWNPPASFPTLYLNETVAVARAQINRLLEPTPVSPVDLDTEAPFVLVEARLPEGQLVADATDEVGLRAVGLPTTFPEDQHGKPVKHSICQKIGASIHDLGLDGIWVRSAQTIGNELAWFPDHPHERAAQGASHPFADWFPASTGEN